jgi:hypothetical protein
MTFSWMGGSFESNKAYEADKAVTASKLKSDAAARQPTTDKQQSESTAISDATIALANKKALDTVNRKTANYNAGVVDPEEATAAANKLKADTEAGMTDYEQYDRKSSLDLKNQDAAWASASKYKQSDAGQQLAAQKDRLVTDISGQKDRLVAGLDNQKEMQRTTINQANKLRSDDNQRAIDGFKMKF